jgi:hypothetical protein
MAIAQAAAQPVPPVLIDDFEGAPLPWHGLVRDKTMAHSGEQCGKWCNMPAETSVALSIPDAHQWVKYNTLEMWIHSEIDNGAPFVLLLNADNPDTPEEDYYYFRTHVSWTGWRFLFLPLPVFGRAGKPLTWDQVTELKLSAIGWGCDPKADTVLRLDDICLSRNEFGDVDALPVAHMEDDIDMWVGLKRSTAYAKEGQASGKWDVCSPSVGYVESRAIPHDWSLYDELRFWVYAPEPTGAKVKIVLFSAAKADDTAGYFTTFEIDWKGWTELVFPSWRFHPWGQPVGWQKIDSVMLTARKWGLPEPPAGTVLYLDNMILRRIPLEAGKLTVDDFEQGTEAWSDLAVTEVQAHTGRRAALMTNFAEHPFTETWAVPGDWTDYDALELWIYSEKANGAPLKVLVDVDSPETPDDTDYFMTTFLVTWTGWRQVQLPKWAFQPWKKPAGWGSVRRLILAGAKWGLEPKPDTVLYLDDLSLVRLGMPPEIVFEDFESGLGSWHGMKDTTQLFKSGSHGGLWTNVPESQYVNTTRVPHDWKSVRALRFWVHGRKANGATIRILVLSDNPATPDTDCYCMDFRLDWEGWKQLSFAKSDFTTSGTPAGWDKVDSLSLRVADPLPLPTTEVVLDDLTLVTGTPGREPGAVGP